MLLWLLFVGTLQASVASSYRGFWHGLENQDASNFQHVPSDQSQPRVAFYQPKPNSLPWPQVLDPKHTPQMSSGQPCFHPRPQLPSYWPYPMPQSPHVPGAGVQPLQVPDPHLPTYTTKPGQQPSDQPTPASQTQHPSQQPQAPGFPALPPSNMPQASGPASKPPSRLLEYWYQKRPKHQSQSSTYPFNWPQVSNPKPQQPSAVPYPWYQQQSQQLLGNVPQPAPTTHQPSLPTNVPQAPKPQAQSQSKLLHPWYQQNPQQQSLGYLFKPQPWLQQPPLPSNLPQPPSAPSRNMPQTPQLTPATLQPDLSNNLPQAQPQNKLPHPWYQHLQYQSPIYLLNSEPYPWLPPQAAPSSNLPQPSSASSSNLPQASPSPSTTQRPALSTQLPQEPALSATPQPAPSSDLPHVHGPETQLSSRLPHPWYHQYQSPSLVKPLPHPWLQVPGPLSQLPSASQQPFNWLHAASAEAQPPSRPLHPWYQFWPPMHGYFPEPTNYRPYGPINLPNAWSWYRPQWPIYLPWTSYLPTMNSCKPPLLCYELKSNGGFYPDSTSSGEPW